MPSSAIRLLEIARETSYMSRVNGVPDASGLGFTSTEFADASQVVAIGTTITETYNAGKIGYGTNPGAPLIDPTLGQAVKSGTLTVDFLLRGGVDDVTGNTSLMCLLGTRGNHMQRERLSATANVSQYGVPTFAASQSAPRFFAYKMADGRVNYGVCGTGTTPSLCEPRPDLGAALTGTKTVSGGTVSTNGDLYEYFIPAVGTESALDYTSPANLRYTCALRLTGDGWQQICYGCSLTALTISADGDGRAIKLSCTIDCPCVVDIDSSDIEPVSYPFVDAGPVLHSLGSPFTVNVTGTSSSFTVANSFCVSAWSLTLTWTTAGASCGSYWQGRAPLEATNLEATLSLTIAHPWEGARSFFTDAWQEQKKLTVCLPFGGDLDVSPEYGGALICPNCTVTSGDVGVPDLSGDLIQTNVTLQLTGAGDLPLAILGVF